MATHSQSSLGLVFREQPQTPYSAVVERQATFLWIWSENKKHHINRSCSSAMQMYFTDSDTDDCFDIVLVLFLITASFCKSMIKNMNIYLSHSQRRTEGHGQALLCCVWGTSRAWCEMAWVKWLAGCVTYCINGQTLHHQHHKMDCTSRKMESTDVFISDGKMDKAAI